MILDTPVVVALAAAEPATEPEAALAALGVESLEADFRLLQAAIDARSRFPLNFGDCFAYAHARRRDEAPITLDADFLKTDLPMVLHPKRRSGLQ